MASSSSYDAKARIYALADPARIAREDDVVKRAVFEALQREPSNQQQLTLSESSAWLNYVEIDELWQRRAPPALPTAPEALKAAEGLLARLEQKCSDANRAWPNSLRGVALLPPVRLLRRAGLHAIARPDGSAWDHWLYRAEPQLWLDGGLTAKAGVFGAQVEIRIGHLGRPVSIRSRWRPLSGERRLTDLSPFRPDTEADAEGSGNAEEQPAPPIINYLLDGDALPQHYLAPYYFQSKGDYVKVSSASAFSITVDIGRTNQDGSRMTLTALAQGGSGDYLYRWAVYSLDDFARGFRELGSGRGNIVDTLEGRASTSSVDLDNGHYVVMLNVKDRATGAFRHHQQQVVSSAFPSRLADERGPLVA